MAELPNPVVALIAVPDALARPFRTRTSLSGATHLAVVPFRAAPFPSDGRVEINSGVGVVGVAMIAKLGDHRIGAFPDGWRRITRRSGDQVDMAVVDEHSSLFCGS